MTAFAHIVSRVVVQTNAHVQIVINKVQKVFDRSAIAPFRLWDGVAEINATNDRENPSWKTGLARRYSLAIES